MKARIQRKIGSVLEGTVSRSRSKRSRQKLNISRHLAIKAIVNGRGSTPEDGRSILQSIGLDVVEQVDFGLLSLSVEGGPTLVYDNKSRAFMGITRNGINGSGETSIEPAAPAPEAPAS